MMPRFEKLLHDTSPIKPGPKRMPRWLSVVLRAIPLPFVWLEGAVTVLMRWMLRPTHRVEGACKMRGACCHHILLLWHPLFDHARWLGRLMLWWLSEVHGFYPRGFEMNVDDEARVMVFGCRHLGEDGRCESYRLRPTVCRRWPALPWVGPAPLVKGCGYRVIQQRPLPEGAAQATSAPRQLRVLDD